LPPNDAVDVVHLLGVTNRHLLASGDYLYWIDIVTGQVVTQFPQALPIGPGLALPSPRGWGRGVVTSDFVLWPTQTALHAFALSPQRTGVFNVPKQMSELDLSRVDTTGGNLVLAGNRLIVATADRLIALDARPPQRD
jgi:hypothetical protein